MYVQKIPGSIVACKRLCTTIENAWILDRCRVAPEDVVRSSKRNVFNLSLFYEIHVFTARRKQIELPRKKHLRCHDNTQSRRV